MYKIGKKWAVATLVSASGGALNAHADQVEANTANETQAVNATQPVTNQSAVTVTSSAATSSAVEATENDKVTSVQANGVATNGEQT